MEKGKDQISLSRALQYLAPAAIIVVVGSVLIARDLGNLGAVRDVEYWDWRRSVTEVDGEEAVAGGLDLLRREPHLANLYLDLPKVCQDAGLEILCSNELRKLSRDGASATASNLEYALGKLLFRVDPVSSATYLEKAISSEVLSTQVARRLVDDAADGKSYATLDLLTHRWRGVPSGAVVGQAFGYAYILIKKGQMIEAEPLLEKLAQDAPSDPEVFRELARVHFFVGDRKAAVSANEGALSAARRLGDKDAEVTALGNAVYIEMRWGGHSEELRVTLLTLVELASQIGNRSAQAVNLFRIGELDARSGRLTSALAYLDSAERLIAYLTPELRIQVLSVRAEIFRRQYLYDEAERELERARSLATTLGVGDAYLTLDYYRSQLAISRHAFGTAESLIHEAIRMAYERRLVDQQVLFRQLLGDLYTEMGYPEPALAEYQEALSLTEADEAAWRVRDLLVDIGRSYICLGNTERAAHYFHIALRNAVDASDSLDVGLAYRGTAEVYYVLGEDKLAETHAEKAIEYLRGKGMERDITWSYLALADIADGQGRQGRAESMLGLATKVATEDVHMFEIERLRGVFRLRRGEYARALAAFERATSSSSVDNLPFPWQIEFGEAIALWRLGRRGEAEEHFESAILMAESRRSGRQSAIGRSASTASSTSLFESFAAFLNEQGRVREAIDANEKGRSRALADLLFSTQRARGKADGTLVEQSIDAYARIERLVERRGLNPLGGLEMENIPASNQFGDDEFELAERRLNRLERSLRGSEPLFVSQPVPSTNVQRILGPHEAIIIYSLRTATPDNYSTSVAYVIRPDSIALVPLDIATVELEDTIRAFREDIVSSERSRVKWRSSSRRLYDQLLAPVLKFAGQNTTQLHVVPEGSLHYLPFAALMDAKDQFLIERFDLSFAPSLTVLMLSRDQNPLRWEHMLLLGDPDGDLPGAGHEATLISENRKGRSRLLLGADATKKALSEEAPYYDIIHVAAHGSFLYKTPLASHIKLYDDKLTVDDIGGLDLSAYLVTLSACETALSGGILQDHAPGEEWVGLYQAFLAAGTPTVLASLWTIDDRYSGPLMTRFYDRLEDNGKARALGEAQRSFIANRETRHPYFWAGFTVLGDPR